MSNWFSKRAGKESVDRSGLRAPQGEEERFFYEMYKNDQLRAKYVLLMQSNLRTSMVLIAKEIEKMGYDVNVGSLLGVMQKMRYGCSDETILAYFSK
jgi:hypothetical protein